MGRGFRLRSISAAIAVSLFIAACIRHTAVLKYASLRAVKVRTVHERSLLISGGTIHSGSCVRSIEQPRSGSVVTLVVTLVPADGHCSGEFFAMIPVDKDLRAIKLGVPDSSDPTELGVVWTNER